MFATKLEQDQLPQEIGLNNSIALLTEDPVL